MIHFTHLLTIIFVIAKIMKYIDWSWWLVFLPSIIPLAISLGMLLFGALMALIVFIKFGKGGF